MYKIGITGSIGSGKTTIASIFTSFNIPVFDADRNIREILTKKLSIPLEKLVVLSRISRIQQSFLSLFFDSKS